MEVIVLSNFAIGDTHLGKAVFAARPFKKGDVVAQFTGEVLHKSKVPKNHKGEHDRYMQIGPEHFLGPSGGTDDFINHSCEPNTGLKFKGKDIWLVAIRDVNEGDEIAWDYSTTLFESSWKMKCDCRTKSCRKIVGDFALLDERLQKRYARLNIIPQYIKEYLKSKEYAVYTKGIRQLSTYAQKR